VHSPVGQADESSSELHGLLRGDSGRVEADVTGRVIANDTRVTSRLRCRPEWAESQLVLSQDVLRGQDNPVTLAGHVGGVFADKVDVIDG